MEDSVGGARRMAGRARRIGVTACLFALAFAEAGGAAQDLRDFQPGGAKPRGDLSRNSPPITTSNQSVSVDEVPSVQPDPVEAAGGAADEPSNAESSVVSEAPEGRAQAAADSGNNRQSILRGLRKRNPSDVGFSAADARSAPWYRTGLGALAVVLALIGMVYLVVRRWLPSVRVGRDDGVMRVAGRTALSPRQSLVLVRVGRKFVVVGVSPEHVDAVCEIADAEEVAELVSQVGVKGPSGLSGFGSWLNREVAEYVRRPGEVDKPTAASGDGGLRGVSRPLKDLLGRLRTLQTGPRM